MLSVNANLIYKKIKLSSLLRRRGGSKEAVADKIDAVGSTDALLCL